MEKMMDTNLIDYYIDCAIPSIITIEYRYLIDFGNPASDFIIWFSSWDIVQICDCDCMKKGL